jgi:hypothetical protein
VTSFREKTLNFVGNYAYCPPAGAAPHERAHLHALPTRDRDETSGEARQLEVEAGQR